MNKISPEYLMGADKSRLEELHSQYESKSAEYIEAIQSDDQAKAKAQQEKLNGPENKWLKN